MLRALTVCALVAWSAPAAAQEAPRPAQPAQPPEPDSIEWLWLSAGAGYQWVDFRTFRVNPDQLSGSLVPASISGPAPSLALGVRLAFLTAGLRATTLRYFDRPPELASTGHQLSTFDFELGFRSTLGRWQPYLHLGGGYATLGGVGDALTGVAAGLDVDGLNVSAAAGTDYFLTKKLSLGLRAGTSVMVLAPDGMSIGDLAQPKRITNLLEAHDQLLQVDGSSVGLLYELSLGVGVHF